MSKRTRLIVQGSSLPRMDRTEIWIGGYHAPMVSAFTPEIDIQDESTPVFGYDATIDTRVLNKGTLNLTSYEHPSKVTQILDVLIGVDPEVAGLRAYKARGSAVLDVVRLTKHPEDEHYIAAEFFPAWTVVLTPKMGDPKAAGVRNLSGDTGIPFEFRVKDPDMQCATICMDVANLLASGGNKVGILASNTILDVIPDGVPGFSGKFALGVEVQDRDSANKIVKSAKLNVTAGMVAIDGTVTITPDDLHGTAFQDVTDINYAHVYFLRYVTTVTDPLLLGDGFSVRGRHDTVPPAAPTGIGATSGGAGLAAITWTDNANSETGFEIQKSTDGGTTWAALVSKAANSTSHNASGLAAATYKFRVRAVANDEVSAWNTMGGTLVVS